MSEAARDESAAPARVPGCGGSSSRPSRFYLAPFLLVVCDELLLRRHWLPSPSPRLGRAFEVVYAPLIWLVQRIRR